MLFNSFSFLIFFVCVLLLHYLPLPWRVKKFNLLWASYLFYAAWNPPFVALLWLSTIVDWYSAKVIGFSQSQAIRRAALLVSLSVNLGLLCFFKYGNFLLENFAALTAALGIEYVPPELNVILPIGISFYTFQTLSYTLDIYRGNAKPWSSFLDFALYVTFFPQLVAGPIVRAVDFLPQCLTVRKASGKEFGWGLNLLLLGLFQKVVVADGLLAPIVEQVYDAATVDFVSAWIGTFAFTGQIFCDFAGYSTCAIGVAMCLGFGLPDNFRFPYAAIGFSDFWRRWHISLSTWLRDYLYIPLGGNRISPTRTQINLMLTMLIGGLWHGAAWTFVVWGGLHGCFLMLERRLQNTSISGWMVWKTIAGRILLAIATFLLVCITWTFFRAESLRQALDMVQSMIVPGLTSTLHSNGVVGKWDIFVTLSTTAAMLLIHWTLRNTTLEEAVDRLPSFVWVGINAAMLTAIVMMPGEDRAFIYFQF